MNDRTLRVLEFPKIRDRLASLTVTAPGRERAERLQPATDVETVRRSLQETADGDGLLDDGEVPLRGSSDIREGLRQARIGAVLQPADLLTLRETLAVIRECKGQFPGVLHDQSSSGATVFMEPLAVVPLGNAIRELAIVEREEIIRLLRGLVTQVAAAAEQIGPAYEALGRVDFAVAKALLGRSMRAVPPRVRTDGVLRLQRARLPLLTPFQPSSSSSAPHVRSAPVGTALAGAAPEPGREVVPIDVWLREEFTTLVITGPNTGGKTVTLKTIGLLTLMAQAGLHIPADEGSEVSVFPQVFADIGDEQSIEQSLSSFSSHMS